MESYFTNGSGQNLFRKDYLIKSEQNVAIANVIILHGLHEHSGYYEELAVELNLIRCNAFTMDLAGHGRSDGEKGYVTSIDLFVQDVLQLLKMVKESYPHLPVIMFGHSMGALICLKLAIDYPNELGGIMLDGAALEVSDCSLLSMLKLRLKSWLWPRHEEMLLKPEILSHDQEAVQRIKEDDLYHSEPVKSCALYAIRSCMDTVRNNLAKITQPIMIAHGDHDYICLPRGANTLFNSVSSKVKSLKMFSDSYHQIHNETTEIKREFFGYCKQWVVDLIEVNTSNN